jgi:predicted nucleic acid-binding protein
MIYLDSSAAVKLVHAEAQSQALRDWLDERADIGWVSSVLLEIESYRALARYAPATLARLTAVLDLIELVDLAPDIRLRAQAVTPVTVRSLDAIHLATALQLRDQLTTFIAYDHRLTETARAAGLPVETPADGADESPDAASGESDQLSSAQLPRMGWFSCRERPSGRALGTWRDPRPRPPGHPHHQHRVTEADLAELKQAA